MKRYLFIALTLAALSGYASMTNRVLYVDQDGRVSSTNALATQAELAAIAESNAIVRAEQAAAADGYNTATQLLSLAASSIISTPVVFMSPEVVGFEAAVTFRDDSKVYITDISIGDESGGLLPVTIDFAFQESLQSVKPNVEYISSLNGGISRGEWDFVADEYVSDPVSKPGTYTDKGGNTYANLYSITANVPSGLGSGFFGIWIPNDAASSDGSVMDMPGISGGYTGTQSWGGHTLTFKGGYLVGVDE